MESFLDVASASWGGKVVLLSIDALQKEVTDLKSQVARLHEENDALLYAIHQKNERLLALGRKS